MHIPDGFLDNDVAVAAAVSAVLSTRPDLIDGLGFAPTRAKAPSTTITEVA